MNQLMETLFDLMNGPCSSEAERRAVKGSAKVIQAVKDRLTLEEFDALWSATTDIFALGFRLGMQLTIEGLRPIVK